MVINVYLTQIFTFTINLIPAFNIVIYSFNQCADQFRYINNSHFPLHNLPREAMNCLFKIHSGATSFYFRDVVIYLLFHSNVIILPLIMVLTKRVIVQMNKELYHFPFYLMLFCCQLGWPKNNINGWQIIFWSNEFCIQKILIMILPFTVKQGYFDRFWGFFFKFQYFILRYCF